MSDVSEEEWDRLQMASFVGVPMLALEFEKQGMSDDEEALEKARRARGRLLAADGDRLVVAALVESGEEHADLTEAKALWAGFHLRRQVLERLEDTLTERGGDDGEQG